MTEQLKITPNGYAADADGSRWMTLDSREARKVHHGIRPRMLPLLADAGLIAAAQGKRTDSSPSEKLIRPADLGAYYNFGTPTVTMTSIIGEVSPALIDGEPWVDTGNTIARTFKQLGYGTWPAWRMAHEDRYASRIEDYLEAAAVPWKLGRYAEIVVESRYGPRWDDYTPEETSRYTRTLGSLAVLIPEPEAADLSRIIAEERGRMV